MAQVDFNYYDVALTSVAPLAVPLDGGTRFVITGMNIAPFAIGSACHPPLEVRRPLQRACC